jgi:ligand-binding SRPBCC domain-containing protein
MTEYVLEREQFLDASLARVFALFADARNLAEITPPWLGFRIRTPLPIEMREGAIIEYTIRLGGVPMFWRTRIAEWQPEKRFVDVQERGPYARWVHEHEFRALGDGVLMIDRVRYALPFGPLGRMAHALVVRALLARIFDFRFARVRALLGGEGG